MFQYIVLVMLPIIAAEDKMFGPVPRSITKKGNNDGNTSLKLDVILQDGHPKILFKDDLDLEFYADDLKTQIQPTSVVEEECKQHNTYQFDNLDGELYMLTKLKSKDKNPFFYPLAQYIEYLEISNPTIHLHTDRVKTHDGLLDTVSETRWKKQVENHGAEEEKKQQPSNVNTENDATGSTVANTDVASNVNAENDATGGAEEQKEQQHSNVNTEDDATGSTVANTDVASNVNAENDATDVQNPATTENNAPTENSSNIFYRGRWYIAAIMVIAILITGWFYYGKDKVSIGEEQTVQETIV